MPDPAVVDTGTEPAWSRDPDALERLFHQILETGDAKGVEAVLTLMVAADPARAVRLHDELRDALVVAKFLGGHR
jgi:hypothetical protein